MLLNLHPDFSKISLSCRQSCREIKLLGGIISHTCVCVCDCRGVVLLNCAGAMNRKGLAQDGLALRLVAPIFIVVEYLLQQPKVANFLFNK